MGLVRKAPQAPTCDQCRSRKVRCNPSLEDPKGECRNCSRRSETCTYEYTPKKPGRPRAPVAKKRRIASPSPPTTAATDDVPAASLSTHTAHFTPSAGSHCSSTSPSLVRSPSPPITLHRKDAEDRLPSTGPTFGSIFGSALATLHAVQLYCSVPLTRTLQPSPEAAMDLAGVFGPPSASAVVSSTVELGLCTGIGSTTPLTVSVSNPAAVSSSTPSTTMADLVAASDGALSASSEEAVDISRIENFASWDEIGFFLSLHMKHQHMLVPLVHRPTFAQDVLHRRDQGDEAFRGLLLSMVAYTIAQCPITWLTSRMDKPTLERLLERCQRGSRIIQIRHQTRPSLVVLASTILDWITSQNGSPELSANLIADVRRLVYALELHRETPREGMSPLELQLSRRIFWEAFAIDQTNALNGAPIQLHEMDGTPPFPLEVDDEFLSPHLPSAAEHQPKDMLSYMTGFVTISKLFKLLCGCLLRYRTLVNDPQSAQAPEMLRSFVDLSMEYVQTLLASLPDQLQPGNEGDKDTVFGTQAVNVYVTALCIELALLDLRAKVTDGDDEAARYEIAERAFRQLEHMPLECIASNGESMRGKILRVILTLLGSAPEGDLGECLWGWWNMYSRVQFISLMREPAPGPMQFIPVQ